MDGMAFLREIKQLMPATPVIVLTAYDSVETAIEATERGASIYMIKPFKVEELLDVIARVLTVKKS